MSYDLNTLSAARLWSYHPDWSAGYEVSRAFRTDIITSRNGTEQRRALRDVVRFSASYRTVVQDSDLRAANHFLRAWQNQPTAVPDFSRLALLTGSSSGGASTLTLASPPAWVAAERLAVLCDATDTELVEIESVADPTITLAETLANAWATGSVLRPAIFGLFNGRLTSSRFHRGAAEISVSIDAYPGGEPVEDDGSAGTTFNSYEVFPTLEPDWSGSPGLEYLFPVEQVDYGIGRTAQFRPIDMAQRLTEATFNLDRDDTATLEQFFRRMKGRRGAFYRGTGEKDFALAATASSGSSFFLDSGRALFDDFGSVDYAENPTAIEVVLTSGTRLHRLITGITLSSGNSRVAVNSAWPTDLTTSNVARLSWMPLVRFASDEMTTRWATPLSATISTNFQSVRA